MLWIPEIAAWTPALPPLVGNLRVVAWRRGSSMSLSFEPECMPKSDGLPAEPVDSRGVLLWCSKRQGHRYPDRGIGLFGTPCVGTKFVLQNLNAARCAQERDRIACKRETRFARTGVTFHFTLHRKYRVPLIESGCQRVGMVPLTTNILI